METVHELVPMPHGARQHEDAEGDRRSVRGVDVTGDAVQDEPDPDTKQYHKNDGALDVWSCVELRLRRDGRRKCFRHAGPLAMLPLRLRASDASRIDYLSSVTVAGVPPPEAADMRLG